MTQEQIQKLEAGILNDKISPELRGMMRKKLEEWRTAQAPEPSPEPQRIMVVRPATNTDTQRVSFSDYPLSAKFMPKHQKQLVQRYDDGDKKQILDGVEAMLKALPRAYAQDGKGDRAIVHVHYFYGESDWYVTEFHPDRENPAYDRLYGFAILNGDTQFAEMGYQSLSELANSGKVELDFYWQPETLGEVKAKADPDLWGKKEKPEPMPEPMPEPIVEPEPVAAVVTESAAAGCAVTRNMKQNGIEIKFPKPPSDWITAQLKSKGFRWSKFQKLWYVTYSEAKHQFAIDLCGETEKTDNPAAIAAPTGNKRLITLAVLTSAGRVPQNILKSEIVAGKLEVARYKRFDGMQDMEEYIDDDDIVWRTATMDDTEFDIKELSNGRANSHWTDAIRLNDDGTINYGSLRFRYKTTVEGHDYSPKEEREKMAQAKQQERADLVATAAKVADLVPEKYYIPFNRPAQRGKFEIENPLKVEDHIGQPAFPVVAEVEGFRLLGTLEAKNVVASVSYLLGSKDMGMQENREDQFLFKAEPGTATPGYMSRFTRYRKREAGDVSDFPGWTFRSFPTFVWTALANLVRNTQQYALLRDKKGQTDRGKKMNDNKIAETVKEINALKRIWVTYDSQYPGALRQVTGQSAEEYAQMVGFWRQGLGLNVEPAQTERPALIESQVREKMPVSPKTKATTLLGKRRQITLPNGEKHDAQFAILELDNIKASHDEETFADTEGYPRNAQGNNLNDRNYAGDKAAQQLVAEYARDLNPELIVALTSTPEGTPIVTPEGIVVSGNNRTMSLKLARKRYDAKWREYQAYLANDLDVFGFGEGDRNQLAEMEAPVLVRIDYDFGEPTTTNMAKYNASSMKAKSPVDKAAELATTLREQILCETNIPAILGEFDTLSDFYADRAAIKRMVAAMRQCSVLNEQDMPAYLDGGYFTEDGKTLLETVLASLILETDTLRIANRDGVKALRQAVVSALPALIQNKNLPKASSLIPIVNEAVRYQGELAASGLPWEDFVNQPKLFADQEAAYDARSVYLNRLMVLGQKRFRDAIRKYNESQAANTGSALFAAEVVGPQEAFEGYIIKVLPEDTANRVRQYLGEAKAVWLDEKFLDENPLQSAIEALKTALEFSETPEELNAAIEALETALEFQ